MNRDKLSEFRNKMKVMCTHPPHHKQRNTSAATKIKIQKIGITTGQVMAQACAGYITRMVSATLL